MRDHTAEIVVASCQRISLADLHRGFYKVFSNYPVTMQPSIDEFRLMLTQRGFDKTLSRVALAGRSVVSF